MDKVLACLTDFFLLASVDYEFFEATTKLHDHIRKDTETTPKAVYFGRPPL
jgi:hypothetical protein